MPVKKICSILPAMAAALIAAIGPAMAAAQSLLPPRGQPPGSVPLQQEMASRMIVKPRALAGAGLANALQANDSSALTRITNMPLAVLRPMSGGAYVLALEQPVPLSEANAIARQLMQDGSIEYAEPDRIVLAVEMIPSDPLYDGVGASRQWHYFTPAGSNRGGASMPGAWQHGRGSSGIVVAVLDTGHVAHEDLATPLSGYDFISDPTMANDGNGRDNDPRDPGDGVDAGECGSGTPAKASSWHGLHVTGTIAAQMNNNIGGAGVAPDIRILPLRVIGKCGGYVSDVADAMRWAAGLSLSGLPLNQNPAHVLNLSLGASGTCSRTFQRAVDEVLAAGKVVVAAAGNDKAGSIETGSISQPANCSGVIAVTAHASGGDNAWYASIGAQVSISAPGGGCGYLAVLSCTDHSADGPGVLSLYHGESDYPSGGYAIDYTAMTGTSMAAPHVAGTAALMLSQAPLLSAARIESYLQSSARAHPADSSCSLQFAGKCGAGLLDANRAVQAVLNSAPSLEAVANRTAEVGGNLTVDLRPSASDPDGDALTFHALLVPGGASLSSAGIFSWTGVAPVGDHALTYYVQDSTGLRSANRTLAISVTAGIRDAAERSSAGGGGGGGGLSPAALSMLALLAGIFRWRRSALSVSRGS